MTNEERERLEKQYPQLDFVRLGIALIATGVILLFSVIFLT